MVCNVHNHIYDVELVVPTTCLDFNAFYNMLAPIIIFDLFLEKKRNTLTTDKIDLFKMRMFALLYFFRIYILDF